MQKLFRSLIAVGGLAGLVACGDDVSIAGPGLAISGAPVTAISVGATVQLSANEAVTWQSSAASVASVDANGLVTAVGAGTASITATSTANPDRRASVTITVSSAVRNVTVSPANAVLLPGGTLGFVANVDADAGVARTVNWTSSNTAVATVTSAGVVTAVTPGSATITAASTVAPTVTGSAVVTVRQPTPATISVQNITVTGNTTQTVNVNNIAGSIDVNMNVDPGEQVVQRVEVLIDGTVACTQNLSGAQSEAMRIAAAFDDIEDVIVSCTINTADFDSGTGVADFFNGPHTVSVRGIIAGGGNVATPSTPLIFNNTSGVIATFTNTNGSDAASAINSSTGLQWISGDVTWTFTGVSYVQGTTVASVSCTVFGKDSRTFTLTNGTNTTTYDEDPWSSSDSDLGFYLTDVTLPANVSGAAGAEAIQCPSAVLSNGQPMPTNTNSVLLNYGSPANPTVGGNAAMPVLQVFRYDGLAPGATPSANGVPQLTLADIASPVTVPWVNSSSSLVPAASGSSVVLGFPAFTALNDADDGSGNDIEEGVDAVTVGVWVPAAGSALPTSSASGPNCNVTGLTSVTTGSQLAPTTVSTAYPVRFVITDALGNRNCADLGVPTTITQSGVSFTGLDAGNTAIGADFEAPTATVEDTSPQPNTGYSVMPSWAVTASDNASGFTGSPLRVNMSRLNADGTTSCVINTGAYSCSGGTTSAQGLTFDGTGDVGTDIVGYYTTSINIRDAAGNQTTLITSQLNAFDNIVPSFTGGISLPSIIAGATTNTFTATATDNLDLNSIFGVVSYPTGGGVAIRYPTQQISAFGSPLDQSATVGYQAANWIRCLNAPTIFAVAANQPTDISLTVSDHAANSFSLTSGAFLANAQPCTGTGNAGAVGNVAITFFADSLPNYGGATLNQVDQDGITIATNSSTSVLLKAVAEVPLNTGDNPFSRVDFFYQDPTTLHLIKIGTAASALAQTQTNRYFTYTFTWDPDASVPAIGPTPLNVVAIGVDAQGDAVIAANGQTVIIVP